MARLDKCGPPRELTRFYKTSKSLKFAFFKNGFGDSDEFSIKSAVEFVTHSKQSIKNVEEWAYAHLIVIAGVKEGGIPRSRRYKGDDIYW